MTTQTDNTRLELINQDGLIFTYRDRTSKLYVTVLCFLRLYQYWISETLSDEIGIAHGETELTDFECFEQIVTEAIDNLPPKESNSADQLQLDFLGQVP